MRSTTSATPIPTGAFASIPPVPTSYTGLGKFGRYARALDQRYDAEPDFEDWNQVGFDNCSYLANGDTSTMGEPTSLVSAEEHISIQADGSQIHPIAGQVWAAAITTRCPELLTDDVRGRIEIEQTRGLAWVRTVG